MYHTWLGLLKERSLNRMPHHCVSTLFLVVVKRSIRPGLAYAFFLNLRFTVSKVRSKTQTELVSTSETLLRRMGSLVDHRSRYASINPQQQCRLYFNLGSSPHPRRLQLCSFKCPFMQNQSTSIRQVASRCIVEIMQNLVVYRVPPFSPRFHIYNRVPPRPRQFLLEIPSNNA